MGTNGHKSCLGRAEIHLAVDASTPKSRIPKPNLDMEPTEVNSNRSALLSGGRMALDETE